MSGDLSGVDLMIMMKTLNTYLAYPIRSAEDARARGEIYHVIDGVVARLMGKIKDFRRSGVLAEPFLVSSEFGVDERCAVLQAIVACRNEFRDSDAEFIAVTGVHKYGADVRDLDRLVVVLSHAGP